MKKFENGSVNVWILVIIVVIVMVIAYFALIKKPLGINQQTISPEIQDQVPINTVRPQATQINNTPVTSLPVDSPSITVISPNGGEVYVRGENVQIKWNITNDDDIVRLVLIPGDIQITSYEYAAANFTSPYSWIIPSNISPGSYKIKANAHNQSGSTPTLRGSDASDNYFIIK